MALRLFERTMASVKPDLQRLYVADTEHGFRLDLVDLDEHIGGLFSALRKQRDENKELRAKFGVTPDSAEALAPFGVMPKAMGGRTVPDVRAGPLPRLGVPRRGTMG
jgi:hypothetical protein